MRTPRGDDRQSGCYFGYYCNKEGEQERNILVFEALLDFRLVPFTMLSTTVSRLASRRCAFTTATALCRRAALPAPQAALFHASSRVLDLPYHIVVGLPALSPTMESGSLAEWYVAEGDAITAGDAVAKIETDKASMDFEAQDDVYVAKLLRMPGAEANDLPVGTPIMITVEDEADVAAFKDYVYQEEEAPKKEEAPAAPEPPKETAAPPPPPEPAKKEEPKEAAAAATPAAKEPESPPSAPASPSPTATTDGQSIAIAWARPTPATSPLAKSMEKHQMEYMKLYGTTGQKKVVIAEK